MDRKKAKLEVLLSEINHVIQKEKSNKNLDTKIYSKIAPNSHVYFQVENNMIERDNVIAELKKIWAKHFFSERKNIFFSKPKMSSPNLVMNLPKDYLQIKSTQLKQNTINWNSYLQSHMITEQDYHFIAKFDQGDESHKIELICSLGVDALDLLLSIINRMSKDQTVAYLGVGVKNIAKIKKFAKFCKNYFLFFFCVSWPSPLIS